MNWIAKQTEFNVSQFDKSMEKHYPESARYVNDPQQYFQRIAEECNYLDAVRMVDWNNYLKTDCTMLDLGGGTGWLSGYLSQMDSISKIYLLDSSKHFLHNMMPGIVQLMKGNIDKIVPIEALFSPLFFDDNSLDAVVICSSLHHADGMEDLLRELRRVLKVDGFLFILNETPHSYTRYLVSMFKQFILIGSNSLFKRYKSISASISSSGYLYDPYLYDKTYPLWYWKQAIINAGFVLDTMINSGLPTVKKDEKGMKLTHFICKKLDTNDTNS